jgi:competence protein ComEC
LKRRLILLILIVSSSSLFSAIYYCLPSAGSAAAANNEILINEVELNPPGTDSGAEKVELYNPSSSAIDVNGWTISSTAGRTSATIVINEGTTTTTIPPKGYVIVGGGDSQQWFDNTGDEAIELRNDSGILIDYVGPFSDVANDDGAWQRSPDGEEDNWVFSSNTLGGANFGTLVSDPKLPSPPRAPEHPIIAQQEKEDDDDEEEEEASSLPATTATNSSVEVAVTPAIQPSQNLTIAFIDVGQGDSILVILPNTKSLLIDGGEREGYGKVLATLHKHALSHIDVVVATHPHADHIGGLVDVIKNVDVGEVLDSGQVHTTQTFEDFLDAIEMKQIPLKPVRQGDSINLDPTVKIDVLNPPVNLLDGADNEAEFNDNSVVLKLTYGEFSALLTGDMEERNEARLVSENTTAALDADVLKAGHHGSRTSSSLSFLNAVTPEVVIISLGAGNTYGHPHQEALDRISAAGVEHLFRTDIDGTITLTVNGSSSEYYSILTESNGKTITTVVVNGDYDTSESKMAYAAPNSSVNLIASAYIQGY